MIEDRPAHLLSDPAYRTLPSLPYAVDLSALPELVSASILDLGGIQPITGEMATAAGGRLFDRPSPAEVLLFRERRTEFQMISVVVSLVDASSKGSAFTGRPFALTLIPASKRGEISRCTIDLIDKLDVDNWLKTEPAYVGYDPFSGSWSMYGSLGVLMSRQPANGFVDEIGLVIDQFFLATEFDLNDVLMVDVGMPTDTLARKYRKHRSRLLFSPFKRIEARRIWGAESPIELFLIQELARRGQFPQPQMLIMSDGSVFPSWYHLLRDVEFRHAPELITEADLYFPAQRTAVFCDSTKYHARRKQREKDQAINRRLEAVGVRPIRIPGKMIIEDLKSAGDVVAGALKSG